MKLTSKQIKAIGELYNLEDFEKIIGIKEDKVNE